MQLKISYFCLQTGHYKYKTFYVASWKPQRKHIVNTLKIMIKVSKHAPTKRGRKKQDLQNTQEKE